MRAALRCLERNKGWLAVLDDLDPTVEAQPVPSAAQNGRTLGKSEPPLAVARRAIEIEIEPLNVMTAARLLLQCAGGTTRRVASR